MKAITILVVMLLVEQALYAQRHNEVALYDSIMHFSRSNAKPVPNTTLSTLKQFNFRDQKEYDWNNIDTLNIEWKQFFNSVKLSHISVGPMDSSFLDKYSQLPSSGRGIAFSPIVISPDGSKAICGVYLFGSGDSMYLFEKEKGKWGLRRWSVMNVE